MRRHAFIAPVLLAVLAGCPRDKKPSAPPVAQQQDTTPVNLDSLQSAIPPAAPDTFTPPPVRHAARTRPQIPPAPPALVEAVEREQSFSRFCYQEYGQKADPGLEGGVAMVVTVGGSGVSDARVADDTWSSHAGKAVNQCLNDKAAGAWKTATGSVKPGKYLVQLSFRPS